MATKNYNWISTCPVWDEILTEFLSSETGMKLKKTIKQLREEKSIYPDPKSLFRAFTLCPYDKVKVMIMGMDPYHTPGVADGLAFSSTDNFRRPPSLKNIFAEILRTEYANGVLETEVFKSNSLASWAKQGVLLLNRTLTVEQGKPKSHEKLGWAELTDMVISKLNESPKPIVYMLWGGSAQSVEHLITNKNHLVLKGYHPQAQNYPGGDTKMFVGNDHFKDCNLFLKRQDPQVLGINWRTI